MSLESNITPDSVVEIQESCSGHQTLAEFCMSAGNSKRQNEKCIFVSYNFT